MTEEAQAIQDALQLIRVCHSLSDVLAGISAAAKLAGEGVVEIERDLLSIADLQGGGSMSTTIKAGFQKK